MDEETRVALLELRACAGGDSRQVAETRLQLAEFEVNASWISSSMSLPRSARSTTSSRTSRRFATTGPYGGHGFRIEATGSEPRRAAGWTSSPAS